MLKISLLFIQNVKISRYHFQMDPKIYGDFQIYISVPLSLSATAGRSSTTIIFYIAAINFVWGNISLYQTFLWLS